MTPPPIADPNADVSIEFTSTTQNYEWLALEAAWTYISDCIFKQACPKFVEDPSTIIQSIHQSTQNAEGNTVTLTVSQYFHSIQHLTNFLSTTKNWHLDVAQHFLSHFNKDIKHQLQSQNYSYALATT